MTEDNPNTAAGGRRAGGWDIRVVFIERRQLWWWNAWRATTSTELYGFADSRTEAWSAMQRAISTAPLPDNLPERRALPGGGAA